MLLSEAKNVLSVWGKHLEYCQDRLQALFIAGIPKSLLPLPAEEIEVALNVVAKHYHDMGDLEASNLVKSSFGPLAFYREDDEALRGAVFKFGESRLREVIISKLKMIQRTADGDAYKP